MMMMMMIMIERCTSLALLWFALAPLTPVAPVCAVFLGKSVQLTSVHASTEKPLREGQPGPTSQPPIALASGHSSGRFATGARFGIMIQLLLGQLWGFRSSPELYAPSHEAFCTFLSP